MDELQDYFKNILAHLDDMAKRTIFMMGFKYGQEKSREQRAADDGNEIQLLQDTKAEAEKMIIELHISGNVRERKNGLIEFRNPQFGSVYGRSVEELRQKLEQKIRYEKAHIKKPEKKKKSPLLSEYFERVYLPYKEAQSRAESTIKGIKYNYKFLMESGFDKPLSDYTAKEIEEFLFSLKQTRKAQILQGMLNNIFNKAITDGILQTNPCLTIEKVEHDTDDGKALSFEDQELFFTRLFSDTSVKLDEKCYFLFVYLTGTRRDEARNLRDSDIEYKNSVIHIPGTKTDGSDRYMPLFPLAEKALRLANTDGKPFHIYCERIYKIFNRLIKGYRLHDLRHSFGTIQICVEKIDPKTVSLWMGHTNTQTTLNTYTHPEQLDRTLFLRGDLQNSEKTAILRQKYRKILDSISAFFDRCTQTVPIL